MITLETDITKISRVGAATAKKLKRLGIANIRDLLFYFPWRYDDFSQLTQIDKLEPGKSANIVGQIELIQNKRSWKKRMYITEALVNDGSETLRVVWFNQPFIAQNLKTGDRVSLAGKVEEDYGGVMMTSPVYEKIKIPLTPFVKGGNSAIHTQGLVPNYHLTANLTHKQVRFLIKQVIGLATRMADWLPVGVRRELRLLNLGEAIAKIHFPRSNLDITKARERLAFDELFLIQLESQLIKRELQKSQAWPIKFLEKETKKFVANLPFRLTNAQRQAAWEIIKDISKDKPMVRLLEGDVGSGKTLVACLAMLNAALNGYQAVLMVPTEILAKQHYDSICRFFAGFDIKIGLVTRSSKKMNYELRIMNNKENTKSENHNSLFIIHNSDVIIGTHALIQEKIKFKNLALAIIDEQHRFGVEQRKALIDKTLPQPSSYQREGVRERLMPHLLSMTATPIPRSLALALYGDLDISIINEMPQGRKKIVTQVVPEIKRRQAYNFIRQQIKAGRQAFVICPLIDLSDKLGVKSVEAEYQKLDKEIFPDLTIGKLHGRLKAPAKEKIMQEFLDNKIKVLVSTSVVEVGVDVPNATIMMIEGADRFGLAQIHQFRGRVGRSDYQSYCFLFTESEAEKTLKRLQALVNHHDGFELAKIDLKFRGPGEVYGTAQKGFPELKIASLFDYALMKQARDQAVKLIDQDPSLASWPGLKEKLGEWEGKAHLE